MGGPGPGDPTFMWKIERKGPCPQVGPGLGPNSDLPFSTWQNPNQIWLPGWGSHICGDESAESGLKSTSDEPKVGLVGKSYFPQGWGLRIGPQYCLLYTSPSPRDVEESRMPSSA